MGVHPEAFDALLFDLDGTLVNTLHIHYQAYANVLALRKVTLSRKTFLSLIGAPAREAIPKFVGAAGSTFTDEEIGRIHTEKKIEFQVLLASHQLETLPAAQFLLNFGSSKPCALVTSGNRHGMDLILASLGWRDLFQVIVTGDDVIRGKPDPEPYLRAAADLGIAPSRCLVFEDSPDGLVAARAAGMMAIDVTELSGASCIES